MLRESLGLAPCLVHGDYNYNQQINIPILSALLGVNIRY